MIKTVTFFKSVIFSIILLYGLSHCAQTTLASDDFSTGWGNWSSGGRDAFLSNPTALDENQGVNLQDNSGVGSSITTKTLNLSTYGSASIEFQYRSRGFWWGLDFWLQYSDDDGVTWVTLSTYRNGVEFNNDINSILFFTLDKNSHHFGTNSKFRIRCDANNDNNDLFIDNIIIKGYPPAPSIKVFSNAIEIPFGDTNPFVINNTDYGSADLGTTISRKFTIINSGTSQLNISDIILSNASDFSIVGTPHSNAIPELESTTFNIRYNSISSGVSNTTVSIYTNDVNKNPFHFVIKAEATSSFFDSDGDGVFDNYDIDDDNDGIEDLKEELACINSNISLRTNYKFLNENFGNGSRAQINTTYDAVTSYCYEDGTASCASLGGIDLNDGEYTVYYSVANGDGINDTPHEDIGSWADEYWYTGLDHTPGDTNGRMALFNAAIDPGIFYTASITGSLPNVPVTYSFWVLNLDATTAPGIDSRLRPNIRVEFRDVNDNVLASITTGEIPPSINGDDASSWHNFSADLTFPVSEFNVFFYNNQFGGLGNDLAIDDISITQTLCDTDGDGVANIFDLDSDNDGIPDVVEAGFGTVSNGNAIIDSWQDSNGNGMHDAFEGLPLLDSDSDGTPNFIDLDSDNDSIFDVDESGAGNTSNPNYENGDGDINGDGVGDGPDTDAVRKKDVNSDGLIEFFSDGILDIYDYYNGSTFTNAYGNSGQGMEHINYVVDSDGDHIPDYIDTYNNTTLSYDIAKTLYAHLDLNLDGAIDDSNDADGDGLLDVFDTDNVAFGSPRDLDEKLQLYFDGRNDYVQDVSITSGWSEISIMGWIKIDPLRVNTSMLFGQNNFYLSLTSNGRLFLSASGTTLNYEEILPSNQWIHVGATYSNTTNTLKLFVNGKPVEEINKSGALVEDTSLFTIGRNSSSDNQFFKGNIDEVRLFDKALSDDEFQKIIYQEIENNGVIKGVEIPLDISTLSWDHLKRYYRFDTFRDDITANLSPTNDNIEEGAKLYNIKKISKQSAPMPFISQQNNVSLCEALSIASDGVNGADAITYDWSIVRIEHDDISFNSAQKHLGLFINEKDVSGNEIEYHVTNNSELNVSWYLKLDGFIDLEGESQLVQGPYSVLDSGNKGKIERDQQGTADLFTYNYWSSPVSKIMAVSNNANYTLRDVLRDGSDPSLPKLINWIGSGFDGSPTNPIGIADYWIWKFNNYSAEDYSLWQHVRSNGSLSVGEGFTMKGPGTGAVFENQNYVFIGRPNNGDINLELNAGHSYLIGNPYPSAIDAFQFIRDNGSSIAYNEETDENSLTEIDPTISGTLYFWKHWGGGSHLLSEYQGGYAVYNFSGAVAAASYGTNNPDLATGGTQAVLPGRYIPVGQGFFVIGENTGELKFNNAQRIFRKEENSNSVFMRNGESSISNYSIDTEENDSRMKFRIGFNSVNTIHRQLLLTIDSLATSDVDFGFDALVLDDLIDDMYWIIEGEKYTIQGRDAIDENTILPLGVHVADTGTNEITIDALENVPDNLKLYLHDKDRDIYHNLKASNYSVHLETGSFLNRFEITFVIPDALTVEEENFNNLKFYYAFNRNQIVILNPKGVPLEKLEIINIMGQSVYTTSDLYEASYNEYEVPNLSTGTYVVRLQTATGILTKKIIFK
ncbi:MAG: choice-of-anchor D domain-containing protein [Winogradskyella sp.]|nr:choice-of-anchor D domain-containing protein [Winogradskyella sp.]